MTDVQSLVSHRQRLIELTDQQAWPDLRHYVRDMLRTLPASGQIHAPQVTQWLIECSEQTCVPIEELALLADIHGGAAAKRQRFRERNSRALYHLNIVPIGCECHPWVIMNRWGFRPDIDSLNHLCLGIHRMPGLLDLMEGQFENYGLPAQMATRTHPGSGLEMPVDARYGVTWNHHRGTFWTDNDFQRLRNLNATLIAQLWQSCQKPDPLFAISQWRGFNLDGVRAQVDRLLQFLAQSTQTAPRLIVMDFHGTIAAGIHRYSDEVAVISNPYPDGYSWSGMNYYNSEIGFAWEQRLAQDFIEACALLGRPT